MPRFWFKIRDFIYLRRQLKISKGKSILSFNEKYNALVLLASVGLGKKVFVSNRSRPTISYSRFLDIINSWVYKLAEGIIAQTSRAKEVLQKRVGHSNIKIIGNPIRQIEGNHNSTKQSKILNVGRFIKSKHQDWLVDYFVCIHDGNWQLTLIGDGELKDSIKTKVENLRVENDVEILPSTNDIDLFYQNASIFAFTSTSEGFPNALGEAMAAGCACISFDCEAGPSELIDDEINGFLVPEGDHEQYRDKLKLLMHDNDLRQRFGRKAKEKIKKFETNRIAKEYLKFIN
jgi:GalNAc-alpha-(1->4)-GalNAc-alpha-(1->3)-diNAcBac-PP-undecaprenol alpha-1,4-N-acetyl-D-galactosaminyltransferase